MCTECRLPIKYDHIAWCRGETDGYTCQCKKVKKEEDDNDPEDDERNQGLHGYYDIYGDDVDGES